MSKKSEDMLRQTTLDEFVPKKIVPVIASVVDSIEYTGVAETNCSTFDCLLHINVLKPNTHVELYSTSNAMLEHEIIGCEGATVFIYNNKYVVYCGDFVGKFQAKLKICVPFNNNSMELWQPIATQSKLTFTVNTSNAAFVVKPAIKINTTYSEAKSVVDCIFPRCDCLTIKWTRKTVEVERPTKEDKEKPKEVVVIKSKEMVVTTGQDIVHAVGYGVLFTTATLNYTVSNGTCSVFECTIDGHHGSFANEKAQVKASQRTRVLSVEGRNILSWEIADDPDAPRSQRLRVRLDTEMEGLVTLVVEAEMELCNATCTCVLPTFTPQGVHRCKGNIAIQSKTTVQINEEQASQLTRVDPKELPLDMRLSNVLHAYKFLSPYYSLSLQITKHRDVDVLVAVIEGAVLEITRTEKQLLYSMKYRLKNTEHQFLRIALPHPNCQLWSASVNGNPVKASGTEGQMLLPLLRTNASTDTYNIEVILLLTVEDMVTDVNTISRANITLPAVDIPVNHLLVTVYMPNDFDYGNWEGDLHETTYFERQPNSVCPQGVREESAPAYVQDNLMLRCESTNMLELQCQQLDCLDKYVESSTRRKPMVKGIKPMVMTNNGLQLGVPFLFEKRLIDPSIHYSIVAPYRAKIKKTKRNLNAKKFLCINTSQCCVQ